MKIIQPWWAQNGEESSKKHKYNAKRVKLDEIVFPSQKEANRYAQLSLLQKGGVISCLEMQKEFLLIPAQFEHQEFADDPKRRGRCLERAVKYKADFSYVENGKLVVEDTKGVRTPEYVIKRKLMLLVHGIKIREL